MEYENLKNTFFSLRSLSKELRCRDGNDLYLLIVKDEYLILILFIILFQKNNEKKFNLNDCILIRSDVNKSLYTKAIVTGREIIDDDIFIKYKIQTFKKEKRNSVVEILKPISYMMSNAVVIDFADNTIWLNSRVKNEEVIVDVYGIDFPLIFGDSILKNIKKLNDRLAFYNDFEDICKFIEKINKAEYLNIFNNKIVDGYRGVHVNKVPSQIKSSQVVIFSPFYYGFDENIFLLNEFIERNKLNFSEYKSKLYSNNMMSIKIYEYN